MLGFALPQLSQLWPPEAPYLRLSGRTTLKSKMPGLISLVMRWLKEHRHFRRLADQNLKASRLRSFGRWLVAPVLTVHLRLWKVCLRRLA